MARNPKGSADAPRHGRCDLADHGRRLGFENVDFVVRLVIAGRSAAALGALVVFRPRRRPMHWQFERPESGLPFEGDISAVTL